MDDKKIIQLYFERNELAIEHTADKYGKYCFAVANNILHDAGEAEECVNDTWLKTWNAIPPKRPAALRLFLAKIARNTALNRYESKTSEKRGGFDSVCLELSDCAPAPSAEEEYMKKELSALINKFLSVISKHERCIFLRRYFYAESAAEIGKRYGEKEENVRLILFRVRAKLRKFLAKEGFLNEK